MASVNVYLHFAGQAEEALDFYVSVFGAKIQHMQRYKDAPGMDHLSQQGKERILHASLQIGETIVMASDAPEWDTRATGEVPGNSSFSLNYNAGSREEADRIYAALSEGGKAIMPIDTTFWGAYFGMVTDKFGTAWMVNYEEAQ